ncbi:uncharacterized protein LOC134220484 [Armigeres subalbatus]|uniref:uncharacterized protein LOC134220484 n=1 Tax=Armigeres subalbatus TaxID=124917 RepID=UPI002ED3884B
MVLFREVHLTCLIVSILHRINGAPLADGTLQKNPRSICPSDDFAILPAEECHTFYVCSNGFETLLECAAGENFNPETTQCDPNYECINVPTSEGTITTTTTTITTSTSTISSVSSTTSASNLPEGFLQVLSPTQECPPEGAAYRIHGENCRLFYYCRDGYERLQTCSAFRRFDMSTGQCLLTTDAVCFPGTEVFDDRNEGDVNLYLLS